MKPLKVLVLFDTAGTPPSDQDFSKELKTEAWRTESHVISALQELGHKVSTVGAYEDIQVILHAVKKYQPDIVFNLMEHFRGEPALDRDVAGLLELLDVSYTGAGPAGLMLCRNKSLSKTILIHHKIRTPRFVEFKAGKPRVLSEKLSFPLIVKPSGDDGSVGISQSSFVETKEDLWERVEFVQKRLHHDALVEEYVEGRELYVSLLGNCSLTVFPAREMIFEAVPTEAPKIATYRAKWDEKYRKQWGIKNGFAKNLSDKVTAEIQNICKQTYALLQMRGYGRIDLRLTPKNEVIVLEANPNPYLARGEDFAESARKGGLNYNTLIQKIITLGLSKVTP